MEKNDFSEEKKQNQTSPKITKGLVFLIVLISMVSALISVFLWEVSFGDQIRLIRLENKVKMLEVDVEDLNEKTSKINIVR